MSLVTVIIGPVLIAGSISGIFAWTLNKIFEWPAGDIGLFLGLSLSATIGLGIFMFISSALNVQESKELLIDLKRKITHL